MAEILEKPGTVEFCERKKVGTLCITKDFKEVFEEQGQECL